MSIYATIHIFGKDFPMRPDSNFYKQIKQYNREMVISGLSSLLLYPENHQHTLFIENFVKKIITLEFEGNKDFNYDDFQRLINSSEAKSYSIDPVENCFVENVGLRDDEYLVLTGVTMGGSFYIQNLLTTIFLANGKLLKFADRIFETIKSILLISDRILRQANIDRLTESVTDYNEDVYFPDPEEFEMKRKSLILNQNEMPEGIKQFVTFIKDLRTEEMTSDYDHPILRKPFIIEEMKYIFVLPTSTLDSISHYILSIINRMKVIDRTRKIKVSLRQFLFYKYRNYCRNQLEYLFRFLSVKRNSQITLPKLNKNLPIIEELFEYDFDNKIIYSIMFFDDFKFENSSIGEKYFVDVEDRINQVIQYIKSKSTAELMICHLLSPMEREFTLGINLDAYKDIYWLSPYENFAVLAKTRKFDIYDVIRFLKWRNELSKQAKFLSYSLLDDFATYYNNNFSFYFEDSKTPNMFITPINEAYSLRKLSKTINDIHLMKLGKETVQVIRKENDEEGKIPIFVKDPEIDRIILPYLSCVDCFNFPFWVNTSESPDTIAKHSGLFIEFSEMFAFWIWQLNRILKKLLTKTDFTQVYLTFRLEDPESWLLPLEKTGETKNLDIEIFSDQLFLHISIFIPLFYKKMFERPDNFAEKKIMSELLSNIASYFKSSFDYTEELEKLIPLGIKKKIHFFDPSYPSNLLIRKENLVPFYQIKHGDIEYFLQNLSRNINRESETIVELTSKKEKRKILNEIVDYYYELLKTKLGKFNRFSLIEFLIAQYEANLWSISFQTKTLASQVECYFGIEGKIKDLKADNSTQTNTSISIRILLEILSAQKNAGKKEIFIIEYLELLAICYHIVNWGLRSDYNEFNISEEEISILPSGRIGSGLQYVSVFDKFLTAKFTDDVYKSLGSMSTSPEYSYLVTNYNNYEQEFKSSIISEFGVDWDTMGTFIGHLYSKAIE